jgi:hypothetical protein
MNLLLKLKPWDTIYFHTTFKTNARIYTIKSSLSIPFIYYANPQLGFHEFLVPYGHIHLRQYVVVFSREKFRKDVSPFVVSDMFNVLCSYFVIYKLLSSNYKLSKRSEFLVRIYIL